MCTVTEIMKKTKIVCLLVLFSACCFVCRVAGKDDGTTTAAGNGQQRREKDVWNYTALFDRALQVYRKNMKTSKDRKIKLDNFTMPFATKLTTVPTGDVEMINGSMEDLYYLVRVGHITLNQVSENTLLTSALLQLDEFYLTYQEYRVVVSDHLFRDFFAGKSRQNYLRIHWNVTLAPKPAVEVTKVVLREVVDRAFIMFNMGMYMYMEKEIGNHVFDRFMTHEKNKTEDTIKRYFADAVREADIASLVPYAQY